MDEKATPATLHKVKMFPVERDARADNSHVMSALLRERLTRAEGNAVLLLELYLLLEEKINHLLIRSKLVAETVNDPLEEEMQSFLSGFNCHALTFQDREDSHSALGCTLR